jgi:hypothetical protein
MMSLLSLFQIIFFLQFARKYTLLFQQHEGQPAMLEEALDEWRFSLVLYTQDPTKMVTELTNTHRYR